MSVWAAVVTVSAAVLTVIGTIYTARMSKTAAATSAQATRVVAEIQAAPAQRAEDLKVLQATVSRVDEENGSLRGRLLRLETLVRSFSSYVTQLTGQMRAHGIEPPAPPDPIDEYNRTGV